MIRKWKFYVTLCIQHAKADQIFDLFHSEILITHYDYEYEDMIHSFDTLI